MTLGSARDAVAPRGRVVVVSFVSIDGVVQAPLSPDEDREGGFAHGGWVPPYSDSVVDEFMAESTLGASGMLLGRRSFEILSAGWSGADDSVPPVAAMRRMPKYVISSAPDVRSLDARRWENSSVIGHDVPSAVGDLTAGTHGDLVVFGAGRLVRGLAEHDLVDEYRLLIFPVVLGAGKRMFDDHGHLAQFALTHSAITSRGVVVLTYVRAQTSKSPIPPAAPD
ncbi:dihydrofolate reductase [Rhodococcus rhodnii]|uniref:Bifunctional pyrimidine deaminase n=2 Tax=Rhodococcus rhodnii TaxID=38312 RepID=R7WMN3_9NOCA|nr:dihydrofolate reductase family protein [Rhodococcus rhodnii]EOM76567.1 bifunctional pyrimidine deaminase [Rhodococcus rhodnii LMG 5362]TXG92173.1 dihydrofolate reductase [Rhodococcus rhodnii]